MLNIENLHVNADDKTIINGINLTIEPGKVYAIMGPNGAGKSSLMHVLTGKPGYDVTKGKVAFEGDDLFDLSPEERAHRGVFLAMQYPTAIPGVANLTFLKTALNATRVARGEKPLDAAAIMRQVKALLPQVGLDESFLKRAINDGFSGGEKKRNDILQMLLLEPKLMLLDETDSGLDIDALKTIAKGVNNMRSPDRAIVVITHYQRLLDYIEPDVVHVLAQGQIVKTGGSDLAKEIEENGYAWLNDETTS